MRIIGGTHKGRKLHAPKGAVSRPTTDKVRESLFNILAHGSFLPHGLAGLRVLDLFAGTGALGLEALSRGAGSALFVEHDRAARAALQHNIDTLGLTGHARVFRRDATRLGALPANAGGPFDVVFLDPPYGKGLGGLSLAALCAGGWLKPSARLVFEMAIGDADSLPDSMVESDSRHFGDTRIALLLYAPF